MSTFNKCWVRGVLKRNEGNPPLGLFCSKDIVFILFCIYEEFWSQDKPVYDFVNTGIRIMQFWFHEVYILVPLVQVVPTSFEKYNSWSVKDYGTPCSFSKEQNRFRPKEFFSRLFPHLISISISDGSFYHLFIIIRFKKNPGLASARSMNSSIWMQWTLIVRKDLNHAKGYAIRA